VILFPASHPRILVTEPHDLTDTENFRGFSSFSPASIGQRFSGVQVSRNFTMVTISGHDKNHAMTFAHSTSDRATSCNRFIVGMGVKANKSPHQMYRTY
jgi:hypothetical protein